MGAIQAGRKRVIDYARANPQWKARAFRAADAIGFDSNYWCRKVMYESSFVDIEALGPEKLDVLEIAGGGVWQGRFGDRFNSYQNAEFPGFDICTDVLPDQKFDLIIADQVFEHLRDPAQAAKNVKAMLKPGGWFLVLTPFLILVHPCPLDVHRWTEDGLRFFLADNGFDEETIRTDSWGNKKAVKANLTRFPRVGFGKDLRNDKSFPLVVWAWAQNA